MEIPAEFLVGGGIDISETVRVEVSDAGIRIISRREESKGAAVMIDDDDIMAFGAALQAIHQVKDICDTSAKLVAALREREAELKRIGETSEEEENVGTIIGRMELPPNVMVMFGDKKRSVQ